MRIDVHWHHLPKGFVDAVLQGRCPVAGTVETDGSSPVIALATGFRQDLPEELIDADLAVAAMDEAGLDVVAPSVAPPLMHHTADPAIAIAVSRAINDGFAELAQAHQGRFRPLANVPMQDPHAAVDELRRSVDELGLSGVQISTNVGGRNLGNDEFRPFWRAVADLDTFVFLHPCPPMLGGKDRLSKHNLGNFAGLPLDTAAAVASLMFDGVYEEVGPLKTCFAHGGGAFPYIVSRWEHGYHARLASRGPTVRNPYAYLDSVYCDSLNHSDAALRFLVEVVGADHVCLGSDYPFDMGEPDPSGVMQRAIEDPAMREQIGAATAARLLGMEEPAKV